MQRIFMWLVNQRRRSWCAHRADLLAVALAATLVAAPVQAADLRDDARLAYEAYAAKATAAFVRRVAGLIGGAPPAAAIRDGAVAVRPAGEDGIITINGGLVHHWSASTFVAGATLDAAQAVSRAYDDYAKMYEPIVAAQLLARDHDTYRIRVRLKEVAVGTTVVLDVTSRVVYSFVRADAVTSVATSEEIREVVDAGTPHEHSLPAGRDSGYLWRATTLTALVRRTDGVLVEMETIGLTRPFPPMLGWVVEPIARGLGRKSVEQSLQEFRAAVLARQATSAGR